MGRVKCYSYSDLFNTPSIRFKKKLNAKILELGLYVELFKKYHWNWTIKRYRSWTPRTMWSSGFTWWMAVIKSTARSNVDCGTEIPVTIGACCDTTKLQTRWMPVTPSRILNVCISICVVGKHSRVADATRSMDRGSASGGCIWPHNWTKSIRGFVPSVIDSWLASKHESRCRSPH